MTLNIYTAETELLGFYGGDQHWEDMKYNVASLMMAVGMQRIKDAKDVTEMRFRLCVYKQAFGDWMSNEEAEKHYLNKVLPMCVGVWTNVTQETRAQYVKRVRDNWWMETQRKANRAMETEVLA